MSKLAALLENTHYEVLNPSRDDLYFEGVYATDLLSTAIKHMKPYMALITMISTNSTLNLAMMVDFNLIILTKDAEVSDTFLQKATLEEITIVKTDYLTHEVIIDMVKRGFL
jgi:serine kinase of HPr protein (carbohydrate metabolism regulator)